MGIFCRISDMRNIRYHIPSSTVLVLLAVLLLTSCAVEKKSVYPSRNTPPGRSIQTPPQGKMLPQTRDIQYRETISRETRMEESQSGAALPPDTTLPLLTLVNDRIVAFEEKSAQWQRFTEQAYLPADEEKARTIAECGERLNTILSDYNELHRTLIHESRDRRVDESALGAFLATEKQDLDFLESECQQLLAAGSLAGDWIKRTKEELLREQEKDIHERMASGDYQAVIELYTQLPLEKEELPSYEATYDYGQALLRSGREVAAAEVFRDLLMRLQKQSQIEKEFKLMQLIADLQFGMQNYENAFERYIDIINRYAGLGENIEWARKQQSMISSRNYKGIEVRNFAELMRAYLTYNVERDGFRVYKLASRYLEDFPESSVKPTVMHILYESKDRAEAWFALVLQQINQLRAEKNYEKALTLIEGLPMQEIPQDRREKLNSLTDELITARYKETEAQRQALAESLQETWNKGEEFLRTREYDQAIEVFSSMLETSYAERADEKIVEASRLAAQEDRRTAAELFVQAGNTNDRNVKIDLLLRSRQLLKGILEKYPRSGLTDKAVKNLATIEEEIRAIDPALLIESESTTDEQEYLLQPAETTVNGIPLGEWKGDLQRKEFRE